MQKEQSMNEIVDIIISRKSLDILVTKAY